MPKNVSFTKDEAILALDVLLSSNQERLKPDCKEIIELSSLLNELPIISREQRSDVFRNCSGICHQLNSFRISFSKGIKDQNVGAIFYYVAEEFAGREDDLHKVATAIRLNQAYFSNVQFGNDVEIYGFPEGALLSHLHRTIEARDGKKVKKTERCEICHLNLKEVYKPIKDSMMQVHLLVPITELNGEKKYGTNDFITVCPTCHDVLHRYRPWVGKKDFCNILR